MLAFIDAIVIPFLTNIYGALGYLGLFVAMTIESAIADALQGSEAPGD